MLKIPSICVTLTVKGACDMVGLRLKELRKSRNMKQDDVAKYLQIARTTYSRYETDEREMTYESLLKLAGLFDVSVDYILGRHNAFPMMLSQDEAVLIEKYRKLDERSQKSIQALVNYEYTQNKK